MGYKNQKKSLISFKKRRLNCKRGIAHDIARASSKARSSEHVPKSISNRKKSRRNLGIASGSPTTLNKKYGPRVGFRVPDQPETLAVGVVITKNEGYGQNHTANKDMEKIKDDTKKDVSYPDAKGQLENSEPQGKKRDDPARAGDEAGKERGPYDADLKAAYDKIKEEADKNNNAYTPGNKKSDNKSFKGDSGTESAGNLPPKSQLQDKTKQNVFEDSDTADNDTGSEIGFNQNVAIEGNDLIYDPGKGGQFTTWTYNNMSQPGEPWQGSSIFRNPSSDAELSIAGVSTYRPEIIAVLKWVPIDFEILLPDDFGSVDGHKKPEKSHTHRQMLQYRIREKELLEWYCRSITAAQQNYSITKETPDNWSGYSNDGMEGFRLIDRYGDIKDLVTVGELRGFTEACKNLLFYAKKIEDNLDIKSISKEEIQAHLGKYYSGDFPVPAAADGLAGYFEKYLCIENGKQSLKLMSDTKVVAQLMHDLKMASLYHSPAFFDSMEYTQKSWRSGKAAYHLGQNPSWEVDPRITPIQDIHTLDLNTYGWKWDTCQKNVSSYGGYIHFVNSLPSYGGDFGERLVYSNRIKLLALTLGKELTHSATDAQLYWRSKNKNSVQQIGGGIYESWLKFSAKPGFNASQDDNVYSRAIGTSQEFETHWAEDSFESSVKIQVTGGEDDWGSVTSEALKAHLKTSNNENIGSATYPRLIDLLQIRNSSWKLGFSKDSDHDTVLPLERRFVYNNTTKQVFAPGYDLFFRSLWVPGMSDNYTGVNPLTDDDRKKSLFRTRTFGDWVKITMGSAKKARRLLLEHNGLHHAYVVKGSSSQQYFSNTPPFVFKEFLKHSIEILSEVSSKSNPVDIDFNIHKGGAGGTDLTFGGTYDETNTIETDEGDQPAIDSKLGTLLIILLMKIIEHDSSEIRASQMRYRMFQLFLVYRDVYLHNHFDNYDNWTNGPGPHPWRPSSCADMTWVQETRNITMSATEAGANKASMVLWGDFTGDSGDFTGGQGSAYDHGRGMVGSIVGNGNTREALIDELAAYAASRLSKSYDVSPASMGHGYINEGYDLINASYLNAVVNVNWLGNESEFEQAATPTLQFGPTTISPHIINDLSEIDLCFNTFRTALRGAFKYQDHGVPKNNAGVELGDGAIPERYESNIFEQMYGFLKKCQITAQMQSTLGYKKHMGSNGVNFTPEGGDIASAKSYLCTNSQREVTSPGTHHLAQNYDLEWSAAKQTGEGSDVATDGISGGGDGDIDEMINQPPDQTADGTFTDDFQGTGSVTVSPLLTRWSGLDDNTLCAMTFEMFWSLLVPFVSVGTTPPNELTAAQQSFWTHEMADGTQGEFNPFNLNKNETKETGASDGTLRLVKCNFEANRQLLSYLAVQFKMIEMPGTPYLQEFWPGVTDSDPGGWAGGRPSKLEDIQEFMNAGQVLTGGGIDEVGLGSGGLQILNNLGISSSNFSEGTSLANNKSEIAAQVMLDHILKKSAPKYQWVWLDDARYRLQQEDQMIIEGCALLRTYAETRVGDGSDDYNDFSHNWRDKIQELADQISHPEFDVITEANFAFNAGTNNNLLSTTAADAIYGMNWEQVILKRKQRLLTAEQLSRDNSIVPAWTLPNEYINGLETTTCKDGGQQLGTDSDLMFKMFSIVFGWAGWANKEEYAGGQPNSQGFVDLAEPWGRNIQIMTVGIPRDMLNRWKRNPILSDSVYKDIHWPESKSTLIRIRIRRRDILQPEIVFKPIEFDFDMNLHLDFPTKFKSLLKAINTGAPPKNLRDLMKEVRFMRFLNIEDPRAGDDDADENSGAIKTTAFEVIVKDLQGSSVNGDYWKNIPGLNRLNHPGLADGVTDLAVEVLRNPAVRVFVNHFYDYMLRLYYSYTLGFKFDEEAFKINSSKWTNSSWIDNQVLKWANMIMDVTKWSQGGLENMYISPLKNKQIHKSLWTGSGWPVDFLDEEVPSAIDRGLPEVLTGNNNRTGVKYYNTTEHLEHAGFPDQVNYTTGGAKVNRILHTGIPYQYTRWAQSIKCCKTFDRVFMVPVDPDWFTVDVDETDNVVFSNLRSKGYIIELQSQSGERVYKVARVPSSATGAGADYGAYYAVDTAKSNDELTMDQFWVEIEYIDDRVSGGSIPAGWLV